MTSKRYTFKVNGHSVTVKADSEDQARYRARRTYLSTRKFYGKETEEITSIEFISVKDHIRHPNKNFSW